MLVKLAKSEVDPSEIASINFGKSNFAQYALLLDMDKLAREGQIIRTRQDNSKNDKQKEKMEKEVVKIKDKILKLADKYKKLDADIHQDDIKNAYITFRSMEGAVRVEYAYRLNIFSRAWLFLTCRKSQYSK